MMQIIKIASVLLLIGYITKPPKSQNNLKISDDVFGNSFASFLSHFPKVETPYEINIETMIKMTSKESQDKELLESIKAFNKNEKLVQKYLPIFTRYKVRRRVGPPKIEPIARIYQGEQYISVLFNLSHFFSSNEELSICMVTYDLNGKPINDWDLKNNVLSTENIATYNWEEVTTCNFLETGLIETSTYKNEWEKDVREFGFQDNRIINRDLTETNKIQVVPNKQILVARGNKKSRK